MFTEDEAVLEFIGGQGRTSDAISERFPEFDMLRLVRAGLVEMQEIEPETEAHAHTSAQLTRYTLTQRGAVAVGTAVDTT
jgi:hypothetical protein